ncbi:MAG: sugar ABC transporter permease [Chloroflexi bacterium]|nr:sugar ABC transporter permease [Chloroflexota bacterium]
MLKSFSLDRWTPVFFLAPAFILLLVFRYVPIVLGFEEALYTNSLSQAGARKFVGLANFIAVYEDPVVWGSFKTTLIFSLVVNPLQVGLALLLAELVNARVPGIAVFRAIYLIPIAISAPVTAIAWGLALDPNYGLINGIFRTVGLPRQPFLQSPDQALWSIIGIISWIGVPYWSLFFLAGLQGISKDVLESAHVDGANSLRVFISIKLPLLRRIIAFVLVSDTVVNFTLFAPVYLLTRGGPQLSTHLVMYEAYRRGLVYGDIGIASAIVSVLLIVVIVVVAIEFIVLRPQH